MANTRQIKQRIDTTGNIAQITKAMEMVSASKMRKSQSRALSARSYAQTLKKSLATLAKVVDPSLHPLLKENTTGIELAIIITTDRGLCGNLNHSLLRDLTNWMKKHPKGEIITVGKKAIAFANFYNIDTHAQFDTIPDNVTADDIAEITKMVLDGFLSKKYLSVDVFYMDFVNTLTQHTNAIQLLPLKSKDIDPDALQTKTPTRGEYIFEPDAKSILNDLLPYYVENVLFQTFLESKASEHSARMVTMKSASENAQELIADLRLEFNKSRQSSITSELLDITTAVLTLQT
jgi:F-type H+-transporting ATPase subunit gamma